ncbi:ABC transporter ATP-binding protein [Jonesia quinghaiensis]|uniref:ABC transporter ATP-binding protein n=1 Tax=Jonesia quinghaiensis TaxID=262806 RepID=UPI00056A61F6|nr:ABC transporter ATP-binding protein [Jonesia quinghaiensis]
MHRPGGGPGGSLRTFQQDTSVTRHRLRGDTMQRILQFARPYRAQLILFLILIAIAAAAGAVQPLLFQRIIDQGITAGDRTLVMTYAGIIAGLALLTAVLTIAERMISARIGEGVIYDLRTAVFDHVQKMPIAFFARTKTGALVQRLNGDVLGAQQAFTTTLSQVVSNTLTVVFVLAAMFTMSWQLTLLALILLPAFIFPARWIGPRLARITRRSYDLNAEAAQTMNERFNVSGAYLAKTYGRPDDELAHFSQQAAQVRDIGITTAFYQVIFRVALTTVSALAIAAVYGLGGLQAISGQLSVGIVVALAAYLGQLYAPLTALSNVHVTIMTALVSFERVLEVLDLTPMIREIDSPINLNEGLRTAGARIDLSDVSFTYPSAGEVSLASLESVTHLNTDLSQPTLHNVSFSVEPGQTVAIVGPSGAGKTTLTHLITRMYDPTVGQVAIAGTDLTKASTASLRETVGVVMQDAHMFHDTIANNLRYANPSATASQMQEALQRAHIWPLIATLHDGMETVIGDRGYRMSGGERQRIAIARLLLKAPDIVVLDEATAHLDSESEAAVSSALNEALRGRTAVVIAHRLSTVRTADSIIVLDEGKIVEQGTHNELLERGGLYAELYNTQFADQQQS